MTPLTLQDQTYALCDTIDLFYYPFLAPEVVYAQDYPLLVFWDDNRQTTQVVALAESPDDPDALAAAEQHATALLAQGEAPCGVWARVCPTELTDPQLLNWLYGDADD